MSRLFVALKLSLHRRVVIKLLPPELASEVSAARFKQEMEFAAGLQHPHTLPVLSAGVRGDLLFYVMPFVEGESLRARITREGTLPLEDRALARRQAAGACWRALSADEFDMPSHSLPPGCTFQP